MKQYFLLLIVTFFLDSCSSNNFDKQEKSNNEKLTNDTIKPVQNIKPISIVKNNSCPKITHHTYLDSNYKSSFSDTIDFPKNYYNTHQHLDSIDFYNIYNKSVSIEDMKNYEGYYFHSIIQNTDSLKQITIISWQDGGYSSIDLLSIYPDTTFSIMIAERGEEEYCYSIIKNDTLIRFDKFTPMVSECFREDSSSIGFYWDEYELNIDKILIRDKLPVNLTTKHIDHLSKLQFYSPDSYGRKFSSEIDSLNNVYSNSTFTDFEILRDSAWGIIRSVE
jgi:hypothetical protein